MSSEVLKPKYARIRCSCSNVDASTLGSSSRAFGTVALSARSSGFDAVVFASYCVTTTLSMPYASLVASMLRWMYGVSRCTSLGLTRNCCVYAGYTPPMRMAEITRSASAPAGSRMLRTTMLAKNSSAQVTAIPTRIVLAGRTELTSVYDAPCTTPRSENASP